MKAYLFCAVLIFASALAHGQNKSEANAKPVSPPIVRGAKAKATPPRESDFLDFKDQVIEGNVKEGAGLRKGSPVFTELGKGDTSMDSIVFKRSDFNDYHDIQMRQRVDTQPVDAK